MSISKSIPYGKQTISESDIESVVEVLRSDFITQGPMVPAFEQAVASYVGARFATGVSSATAALHLACKALEVGPGDHVWTSPITFVASANCARYCGASVDFVDIDPGTYNLCPRRLEQKLVNAQSNGTLPKVVIPVHLAGQSCEMEAIHNLSKKYGFKIIEDASHAIGGSYQNEKVGSCSYSDITVFSFHPVKIITSGEGGIATTNSSDLDSKLKLQRSHGITRDPEFLTRESDGPWYYEQLELGFNYRLTDMQAALGLNQLKRLDDFIARRREIAAHYDSQLEGSGFSLPWQPPATQSSHHLYVLRLPEQSSATQHRQLFEYLRAQNIIVNLHYIPVYRQPYYAQFNYDPKLFPNAECYYHSAISIPIYFSLSESEQDFVIDVLNEGLKLCQAL